MTNRIDRAAIIALFEDVRAGFPKLMMALQLDAPNVDLNMDVQKQPGLAFDVNLNLQGDELHLLAGSFWLEWFPCTDVEVVAKYREAVTGLLSGDFRILEHRIGEWVVKAQLQRPVSDQWQTIGTWANVGSLIPWPRTTHVVRNIPIDDAA